MSAACPPQEALLLDYAAGCASPAIDLLVATHLTMSSESRAMFFMMEALGGALLEDLEDEPLERISASRTIALAHAGEPLTSRAANPETATLGSDVGTPPTFREDQLPEPLKPVAGTIDHDHAWRKLGIGVAAKKLPLSSEGERAHLLWARGGTGIATHRHVGREVVLVLQGAFWDDGVRYGPGDVAVSEDGTIHTPRIDGGEDCLCLAVTEAPVHFTGLIGLALNRFCRF